MTDINDVHRRSVSLAGPISLPQAETLAKLMKENGAHAAEFRETEIIGMKVTVVILSHEDQREGSWKTAHVLGSAPGTASIANLGVIPGSSRS